MIIETYGCCASRATCFCLQCSARDLAHVEKVESADEELCHVSITKLHYLNWTELDRRITVHNNGLVIEAATILDINTSVKMMLMVRIVLNRW